MTATGEAQQIAALQARIVELEARIAELEMQLRARPVRELCPVCRQGSLLVIKANILNRKRTLQCDNAACGHMEQRRAPPATASPGHVEAG